MGHFINVPFTQSAAWKVQSQGSQASVIVPITGYPRPQCPALSPDGIACPESRDLTAVLCTVLSSLHRPGLLGRLPDLLFPRLTVKPPLSSADSAGFFLCTFIALKFSRKTVASGQKPGGPEGAWGPHCSPAHPTLHYPFPIPQYYRESPRL